MKTGQSLRQTTLAGHRRKPQISPAGGERRGRTAAQDALRERIGALENTIEHMDQGVSIMDADLRVVGVNRRFRELLAFPESLCRPGTPLETFLRYNAARGDYGPGDVEEQVRTRMALARKFEAHRFERERPDGTVLEIRGLPIPGGGFVTLYTDVTQRARSERALRESEARKGAILEASLDAILTMDHQGRITEFNPAAERCFGYAREQAIGGMMAELIVPPELRERHREGLRRYLATGEAKVLGQRLELPALRADGSRFDAELAISLIPGTNPPMFTGSIRDVTQRARSERALRESEARFRSLTELSSDWYWEQDDQFRFTVLSGAGAAAMSRGGEPSVYLGKARWEIPDLGTMDGDWSQHRTQLERHEPFRDLLMRRRMDDGILRYMSVSGEPVYDERGGFAGYRGVARNVTQRVEAERALRASEERYEAAMRAINEGVYDYDIANDAIYYSDRIYEVLDTTRDLLRTAADWRRLIHPDDLAGYIAAYVAHMKGESARFALDYRYRARDGALRWARQRGMAIRDGKGCAVRVVGSVGDITELKHTEQALRQSEERFRALSELSSDLYWETDAEHRITQYSYGAKIREVIPVNELLGRRRWEVPGVVVPDEEGWRAHRATLDAHLPFRDFENARRGSDGNVRYFSVSGEPVFDAGGAFTGYRGVGREITEQKTAEARLDQLAHYDTLTGLPNRALLLDRMHQARARADRGRTLLAVMFLDLDRFKEINDSLGHAAGDEVLRETARRLQSCLRTTDTVARLGGDEFTVLLEDVRHIDEVSAVARKILEAFAEPAEAAGREVHLSTSIGITVYPLDDQDADTLLKSADIAMYQAKQEGRNNFQFFAAELGARTERRAGLRLRLHRALERGEFALHYQPQVGLAGGGIFGVEALLRWNDAELGPVPPGQFIPVAEEMGLIVPIGDWVLHEACRQCKSWLDAGLGPLRVAVNLSPRQFRQKNLAQRIGEILRETGLPAACLEIEITEGIVMKHAERAIRTLTELNRLGVQIAIDDFGTGYSSLAYLQRFPVHVLKIDQSFVQAIRASTDKAAIVDTVIHLAKLLGLKALAEGVETVEQQEYLRARGCDAFQGYLFCKPQPAERIGDLLAAHRRGNASALP